MEKLSGVNRCQKERLPASEEAQPRMSRNVIALGKPINNAKRLEPILGMGSSRRKQSEFQSPFSTPLFLQMPRERFQQIIQRHQPQELSGSALQHWHSRATFLRHAIDHYPERFVGIGLNCAGAHQITDWRSQGGIASLQLLSYVPPQQRHCDKSADHTNHG